MKIGIFLDVDKTLTRDFIQHEYAKALRCETEYIAIEKKLQAKEINEAEFGEELISLFASKSFKEGSAVEHFDRVGLQPWTEQLLGLCNADVYLVSSGPSYYIDRFAEAFKIPKDNVCRSKYSFRPSDGLINSCDAVNSQQKAQFVKEKISRYSISIGVGDNPEKDGPFVSHCTIPLLTKQFPGYIFIPDLNSVLLLVRNLSECADVTPPFDVQKNELDLANLTVGALFSHLKPGQVWGLTSAFVTTLAGVATFAFWAGQKFHQP